MSDTAKQITALEAEVAELKGQVKAMSAGLSAAIAALSIGLRELKGDHKTMDAFIRFNLQNGWPIVDVPENEASEIAYALPLRVLLQDHEQARDYFRKLSDPGT